MCLYGEQANAPAPLSLPPRPERFHAALRPLFSPATSLEELRRHLAALGTLYQMAGLGLFWWTAGDPPGVDPLAEWTAADISSLANPAGTALVREAFLLAPEVPCVAEDTVSHPPLHLLLVPLPSVAAGRGLLLCRWLSTPADGPAQQAEWTTLGHALGAWLEQLRLRTQWPLDHPPQPVLPQPAPNPLPAQAHQHWHRNFSLLSDNVPELLLVARLDGTLLHWNKAVLQRLGYPPEELAKRHVLSLHPPGVQAEAKQAFARMLSYQTGFCTLPLIANDGEQIPVEIKIFRVQWKGEAAVLLISHDLSKQLKSQTVLQESQLRLTRVMEAVNDAFWDWDLATNQVVFNDRWFTMLGYTAQELPSHLSTWELLTHPEDLESARAQIQAHLAGRLPFYECELRMRTRTGDWLWILDRGRVVDHGPAGQPRRMCGTHTDISLRKQLEEGLRRSEENNRAVLSAMPDLLFRMDKRGVVLGIKTARPEDLLAPPEQLLGKSVREFMPPSLVPAIQSRITEALDTRQVVAMEYKLPLHEREQHFEARFAALTADEVVVISRNVTEKVIMNDRLAERDRLLHALNKALALLLEAQDLNQTMPLALEIVGRALAADRAYLFECHHDPHTGLPLISQRVEWCQDRIPPQINHPLHQNVPLDAHYQRWTEILSRGRVLSGSVIDFPEAERPFLEAQGIRSLILAPIILHGKFIGFVGFDDCQREHAWSPAKEEILRVAASGIGNAYLRMQAGESLRKVSMAVEQSPVSIMITDRSGAIEYVNPRFTEALGYTPKEVIGQNPRMLKSGGMPQEIYQKLWQTVTGGQIWQGQLQNRRKDGSLIWERLSISPLFNSEGKITHFVAIRVDETERKHMEEQVMASLEQARHLNALKSGFVTLVSHEFRTPLGAILSAAELLEDSYDRLTPERRLTFFGMIKREVRRLADMLEEILAMERLDAGRMAVNPKPVDLLALGQRLLEELAVLYAQHACALEVEGRVPERLMVDNQMLHHILVNLVANAFKYSPPQKLVRLILRGQPGGVGIEVHDEGIGIPAEGLAHIFEAFYRAPNVANVKGTGIGLYVVKRCVDLCGGQIRIESVVGRGTSVFLFLPEATKTCSQPQPQ
jgi:PAS domain S-box-containing protein